MNHSTEKITETTAIYGIQKVKMDGKKRIAIPTKWRELLKPGSYVHILNTWHYLIIIPKHLHTSDPDSIVHEYQIENNGRVLIWKALLKAFGIEMDREVFLIGKWNHIELYWDKGKIEEAISRSQKAVNNFQASLISIVQ